MPVHEAADCRDQNCPETRLQRVVIVPLTCDNRSAAPRWWNTKRPLTTSLDLTKEGLMPKDNRKRGLPPIIDPPTGLTPELLAIYNSWPERFASKVDVTEGCWAWTRCKVASGYGRYARNGARDIVYTHRYVIELAQGLDVLDGMQVDHLCRNKACVRPDHLEVVTHGENLRRGRASNDSSGWCRSGRHRWVSENIGKSGRWAACLPCQRERRAA